MLLTSERARSGADADQSQENSMAKQQRRQISPQDDTEQQADTVYKIVEVVGVGFSLQSSRPLPGPPISPSMNVSASLTKSIFHCGKAGRRGAFIAASTKRMRASMALSRNQMTCQATERQATFPGKTEPRAARAEGPVAGVNSRAARARDCQHKRFCIARRPHCRRSKRAIA